MRLLFCIVLVAALMGCHADRSDSGPLRIKTDSSAVVLKTFYHTATGYGRIEAAATADLIAHFDGYIRFNVKPSPVYRKGELVYRLQGQSIDRQRQELRSAARIARAQFHYAKELLERKKSLKNKHFISQEEWQRLYRDFEVNQQEMIRADSLLAFFEKTTQFRAPFNGTLRNIRVAQGSYVEKDQKFAEFLSGSGMKLVGNIFEGASLPPADSLIQVVLNDSLSATGRIIYLEQAVNPQTGGREFWLAFSRSLPGLVPGMFAKFQLRFSPYRAAAVPRDALIREKGKYYLVLTKKGEFKSVPVVPGSLSGKYRELRNGPPPGTNILTTGAFEIFHANLKKTMKIED